VEADANVADTACVARRCCLEGSKDLLTHQMNRVNHGVTAVVAASFPRQCSRCRCGSAAAELAGQRSQRSRHACTVFAFGISSLVARSFAGSAGRWA
jgi:hypothetical protein